MDRAKERALYLLGASAKTESWMRRKLSGEGYPAEAVDYALNVLKEYHYIDDRAYTEAFIRFTCGKKSLRQIEFELQQKGVSKELIRSVLEEFPVDEEESARGTEITREERNRLAGYLSRKGYSLDVINRVIREFETSGSLE